MMNELNEELQGKRRTLIEGFLDQGIDPVSIDRSSLAHFKNESPDSDPAVSAAWLLVGENYSPSPAAVWCSAFLQAHPEPSLTGFFRNVWCPTVVGDSNPNPQLCSLFWSLAGFTEADTDVPSREPALEGVGDLARLLLEQTLGSEEGPGPKLCGLAFACGTLDQEFFEKFVLANSEAWAYSAMVDNTRDSLIKYHFKGVDPAVGSPEEYRLRTMAGLADWFGELLPRLIQFLPEESWDLLGRRIGQGSASLIAACEAIEREKIKSLAHDSYPMTIEGVVANLASSSISDGQLEEVSLRPQLEVFSDHTLFLAMEYQECARPLIGKILSERGDFDKIVVLRDRLKADLIRTTGYLESVKAPESGGVHAAELRSMIAGIPAPIYEMFRSSLVREETELTMALILDALEGKNEKKLAASIRRHAQMPLKAYALLPLPEKGKERRDEVLRRYQMIEDFLIASKKFGSERRANSQICAEVARENLALNAGHDNADSLFFEMEAQRSVDPGDLVLEDGAYRIEVGSEEGLPKLRITKAGKPLKSVPAAIKKTAAFKALKASCDELRIQRGRFLRALESKMNQSACFSGAQIKLLWKAPLLRELLSRLVFIDDEQRTGLPGGDGDELVACDGTRSGTKGRQVQIAHPVRLHRLGVLEAWRTHCFERELLQPIRQLFREFYLLTDAERTSSPQSHRFAGHLLATPPLSGLMKTRVWNTAGVDGPEPRKTFSASGVVGHFELRDCGHFLTETPTVTSGAVSFTDADRQAIPLEEVPECLFSEVMRDADLFVSVAQTVEDGIPSKELMAQRLLIMDELVRKLRLKGVSHSDHHAIVEGKRTRYRIHLGSGAVHMGPGNHLCIVPKDSWKKPAKVFLPFLDDDDPRIAEIFSKILMLAADDKIRDKVILEQIDRSLVSGGSI